MKKLHLLTAILILSLLTVVGCKKNKPPAAPNPPTSGSYSTNLVDTGWVDTTYFFYVASDDPEGEQIAYKINWNDGTESDWSSFKPSGECATLSHKFSTADSYSLKAKAKDVHNNESDWSSFFSFKVFSKSQPPDSVSIFPLSDSAGISSKINFLVRAVDPDTNKVRFLIKWGQDSGWATFRNDTFSFIPSAATDTVRHLFQDTGTFIVKAKAADVYGSLSVNWSTPCTVKITTPRKPYTPSTPTTAGLPKRFLHTPYPFNTIINQFVGSVAGAGGDTGLIFQFNWGDGSSLVVGVDLNKVESGQSGVTSMWADLYHSYDSTGPFFVSTQMKDKWAQFSDPSSPCSLYLEDNFLYSWNSNLNKPTAIAISGDTLFIVDFADHNIKLFNLATGFLGAIGSSILKTPKYIAVDSECIYVTDASDDFYEIHKVYVFYKDGTLKASFGAKGSDEAEFKFPTGIAVDSAYIYVVDSFNKRIQKFRKDSSYSFEDEWDLPTGAEALGMKLDNDYLYVASNNASLVYVYNTSGTYLKTIGASNGSDANGYFLTPCDLAIFADTLYVVEAGVKAYNNRVQKFTKSGSFLNRWGESGSKSGQFKVPQGIAVDNSGNIYVVDTGNSRIQVFKP